MDKCSKNARVILRCAYCLWCIQTSIIWNNWNSIHTVPVRGATCCGVHILTTGIWSHCWMKDGREQRQRNATETATPANNKLQNKRLECLEFYFLGPSVLKTMGNKVWMCTYGCWRLLMGLLDLVGEIAWRVNLTVCCYHVWTSASSF